MKSNGLKLYFVLIVSSIFGASHNLISSTNGITRNPLNSTEYELVNSWKQVERAIKKDKDKGSFAIDQIAIYTHVSNGINYKYYYTLFDPEKNECILYIAIVSIFVTSEHEIGHSLKSNEMLCLSHMKIHNDKYNIINTEVSKWLEHNNMKHKCIFSIGNYVMPFNSKAIIYLIKASVMNKQSLVSIVIIEDKDTFEVIKQYDK